MKFEKEILVIKESCLKAGETVLHYFTERNFDVTMKSPNNPLTKADIECNNILIEAIRLHFPKDSIISEEISTEENKNRNYPDRFHTNRVWIIDPIDGTKEFIDGVPEFAISIGLLQDSELVLGFIYNPAKDFFVYGGKSMGLVYNNVPFTPKPYIPISSLSNISVSLSRSETKKGLFNHLNTIIPQEKQWIIGSVAYKLGLLAVGNYDLLLSLQPKNEWDIAGGAALLKALDHEILDQYYNPILFNKLNLKTEGLIAGHKDTIVFYKNIIG